MEPSVKDKHIILGFVGFAILLISSIATLIVAEKFNQDTFVRLIVFVCSNLLGWLLYFSFQTVIFDTYEIYRIKFGRKKTPAEITEIQEDQSQDAHKPVISASMPTGGEATPDINRQRLPYPRSFTRRTVPITRTGSSGKMRSASLWSWNTSISSCPVLLTRRP